MTRTGLPGRTRSSCTAANPPDANVDATRPRSQQMLYARSSTGRSLRLPVYTCANASRIVGVPIPSRRLPVTKRSK